MKQYLQSRELNVEVRYNHDECSDGRQRLYVKFTGSGHALYCHNCGWKHFMYSKGLGGGKAYLSLGEAKKMAHKANLGQTEHILNDGSVALPRDYTKDIPKEGLLWLWKYDIVEKEIAEYRFGYSAQLNRLILPVYQNDKLIYWQGRALGPVTKENPKYLNIRQRGAKNVVFNVCCPSAPDTRIVIVEDILSAIRCGRYMRSLALLGSYISNDLISSLKGKEILIFLDEDKYTTSLKYCKRLKSLGIKAKPIYHKKDPKEITNVELKEILR